MESQRDSPSLRCWSLLLLFLSLVIPPATTQTLSYQEAVRRAVDGFNRRSLDTNLYRLLDVHQQPSDDQDPNTPQPISFLLKETVCPKTTQQPLEQCDFKENGLVKECLGTVILDVVKGSFDMNCNRVRQAKLGKLSGLFLRGAQKIGEKIEKIGQRIKDFFENLRPREEPS